jgi:hypothetical protein
MIPLNGEKWLANDRPDASFDSALWASAEALAQQLTRGGGENHSIA